MREVNFKGPSYRMPIPPAEERLARMQAAARDAKDVMVERADVPGSIAYLLYAIALAHTRLEPNSPHHERLRALAKRTLGQYTGVKPNESSARHMVTDLIEAVQADREKVGY